MNRREMMKASAGVSIGSLLIQATAVAASPDLSYFQSIVLDDVQYGAAMLTIIAYRSRIIYEPTAGHDFWKVAREAIRLATCHSASTFYSFNGFAILAQPDSEPNHLYELYMCQKPEPTKERS